MSDIVKEIQAVLTEVESFTAQGGMGQTRAFAELMYDDDVLLVGEGDTAMVRGIHEAIARVASAVSEWGEGSRLKFRLNEPVLSSGLLLSAMMDAECHPEKPGAEIIRYRVLAVWKRGPRGWRVAQEMFTSGSL